MQAAMVVTWTHPVVGREEKALAYGIEVQEFWSKKAAEGKCSEPELFFSEAGSAMWFVKGDRDTLMALHDTDEARMLTMKGELLLDAFRLEFFATGDDATDFMLRYGAALVTIA
jgi:hypothetical protein